MWEKEKRGIVVTGDVAGGSGVRLCVLYAVCRLAGGAVISIGRPRRGSTLIDRAREMWLSRRRVLRESASYSAVVGVEIW